MSRDNIVEQMSGLSLISIRVRKMLNKAYNAATDTIRENVCKDEIKTLPDGDLDDFFNLIDAKILTDPATKEGYGVYYFCVKYGVPRAYNRLLEILGRIDVSKIPFSLGGKFKDILRQYNQDAKLQALLAKNGRLMRSIDSNHSHS